MVPFGISAVRPPQRWFIPRLPSSKPSRKPHAANSRTPSRSTTSTSPQSLTKWSNSLSVENEPRTVRHHACATHSRVSTVNPGRLGALNRRVVSDVARSTQRVGDEPAPLARHHDLSKCGGGDRVGPRHEAMLRRAVRTGHDSHSRRLKATTTSRSRTRTHKPRNPKDSDTNSSVRATHRGAQCCGRLVVDPRRRGSTASPVLIGSRRGRPWRRRPVQLGLDALETGLDLVVTIA